MALNNSALEVYNFIVVISAILAVAGFGIGIYKDAKRTMDGSASDKKIDRPSRPHKQKKALRSSVL